MIKALRTFGPTRGFILLLAAGLVAWGAFVANPFHDVFETASFYSVLSGIATEPTWGVAFMTAGGVMLYGVLKRNLQIISVGAMVGFGLWFFLSCAYLASDNFVTPIITNFVLALIHAWAWLVVKLDPSTITNTQVWTDAEVAALRELAEFRKEYRDLNELIAKNLDNEDQ